MGGRGQERGPFGDYLGCGFFLERPREHELGLEHGIAALNPTITHPALS